ASEGVLPASRARATEPSSVRPAGAWVAGLSCDGRSADRAGSVAGFSGAGSGCVRTGLAGAGSGVAWTGGWPWEAACDGTGDSGAAGAAGSGWGSAWTVPPDAAASGWETGGSVTGGRPATGAGTTIGACASSETGSSNSQGTTMKAASTSARAPIRRRRAFTRNSRSWASVPADRAGARCPVSVPLRKSIVQPTHQKWRIGLMIPSDEDIPALAAQDLEHRPDSGKRSEHEDSIIVGRQSPGFCKGLFRTVKGGNLHVPGCHGGPGRGPHAGLVLARGAGDFAGLGDEGIHGRLVATDAMHDGGQFLRGGAARATQGGAQPAVHPPRQARQRG